MHLFPERDRRGRRYAAAALVLSLALHAAGGVLWLRLARSAAHARPVEELLAKTDPIRIERLPPPTPTPSPTPMPLRPRVAQGRPVAAKRAPARPPAPRRRVVAALARPTFAPRPEPTVSARKAKLHVPPARHVAMVTAPHGASGAAPASGALSERQLAALDATFRTTIDDAQRAAAAPHAGRAVAVQTMKRYDKLLDAGVADVVGGDGYCDPLDDGSVRGAYTYYYLRCTVHYADGYVETVSFPWPYRFTRQEDPFAKHDGRHHHFPPQAPPDGFVLRHPFALSRAVCTFYHDECKTVIEREHANGDAPAGGGT